jgi:hypothetical protein
MAPDATRRILRHYNAPLRLCGPRWAAALVALNTGCDSRVKGISYSSRMASRLVIGRFNSVDAEYARRPKAAAREDEVDTWQLRRCLDWNGGSRPS